MTTFSLVFCCCKNLYEQIKFLKYFIVIIVYYLLYTYVL